MATLRNPKHELFCQNIVSGMTVSEAYHAAGYSTNNQAASNLHRRSDVKARIQELFDRRVKIQEKATEKATERAADKMALTKEYVLTRLMENVERSMQAVPATKDGGVFKYDGSVANRALELLGKELGLFIDRKEVGKPGEFDDLDADALRQVISERLGLAKAGH